MEAGVLVDVAPDAGLDDSGPEDAGLDDSVLEDAGPDDPGLDDSGLDDPGLDDPGLDDSGLDDPAALVDGMLDDVTVEAALDEVADAVADAVLEAAGAVAAVELLVATPFELELHAVSSAQAAARATRPFVLFIRVPFFFSVGLDSRYDAAGSLPRRNPGSSREAWVCVLSVAKRLCRNRALSQLPLSSKATRGTCEVAHDHRAVPSAAVAWKGCLRLNEDRD